jgi:hypothetical protein
MIKKLTDNNLKQLKTLREPPMNPMDFFHPAQIKVIPLGKDPLPARLVITGQSPHERIYLGAPVKALDKPKPIPKRRKKRPE